MKAVEVTWYDAFELDSGWMSVNDMENNLPAKEKGILSRTRGWLYSEDEFKVVVVMTWASEVEKEEKDEESLRGVFVIPRGMVVEIREQ